MFYNRYHSKLASFIVKKRNEKGINIRKIVECMIKLGQCVIYMQYDATVAIDDGMKIIISLILKIVFILLYLGYK